MHYNSAFHDCELVNVISISRYVLENIRVIIYCYFLKQSRVVTKDTIKTDLLRNTTGKGLTFCMFTK